MTDLPGAEKAREILDRQPPRPVSDRGDFGEPEISIVPSDDTPLFDYTDEPAANGLQRQMAQRLNGKTNGHTYDAHINGQATDTASKAPVRQFPVLWFATLGQIQHQDQLVKGLLIARTLSVVFGESNSGKTFWVLDLALTVAAGVPWRGRRTKRGVVVYVAGEGAASVRTRVAAYLKTHPDIGALPFCIVPQAVDFLDEESVTTLVNSLRSAEVESGEKVVWVIIDTFARAIPGGNENDAQDVGMAVSAADRIRAEIGTAVTFVHHAGKDPTKGARGSSALRAATDTEILIEGQTGPRTATVTKQRDLVSGERFGFTLRTVDLGTDPDGDPLTSCIVEQAEEQRASSRKIQGKNQSALLAALQERHRTHPEKLGLVSSIELREITKAQGMNRGRAKEAVEGLVGYGWLTPATGGYQFLPEESSP
jgi:hypothetical protein